MRPLLISLLLSVLLLAAPEVEARSVRWSKVEVRKGPDAARVSKRLRRLLRKASRRVKWGKGKRLKLSAQVKTMKWVKTDDVLRVTVTVVARTSGGPSARSHIRLGGRPSNRLKLEKEALKIVANGLVTRLSTLARNR